MVEMTFRGKRIDNGEWVRGGSILQFDKPEKPLCFMPKRDDRCVVTLDENDNITGFDVSGMFYAIQPETIGRCMEREDDDGQGIFEGDVIQCGKNLRFVVKYGVSGGVDNCGHKVGYIGFYFECLNEELFGGLRTDPVYYLNAYQCKVIGNIYDNPELIAKDERQ